MHKEDSRIITRYWRHPRVRKLPERARFLLTYLITGPHGNISGACHVPVAYILSDLTYTRENDVINDLKTLVDANLIQYDFQRGWVWIVDYFFWAAVDPKRQQKRIADNVWRVPEYISFKPALQDAFATSLQSEAA